MFKNGIAIRHPFKGSIKAVLLSVDMFGSLRWRNQLKYIAYRTLA